MSHLKWYSKEFPVSLISCNLLLYNWVTSCRLLLFAWLVCCDTKILSNHCVTHSGQGTYHTIKLYPFVFFFPPPHPLDFCYTLNSFLEHFFWEAVSSSHYSTVYLFICCCCFFSWLLWLLWSQNMFKVKFLFIVWHLFKRKRFLYQGVTSTALLVQQPPWVSLWLLMWKSFKIKTGQFEPDSWETHF